MPSANDVRETAGLPRQPKSAQEALEDLQAAIRRMELWVDHMHERLHGKPPRSTTTTPRRRT